MRTQFQAHPARYLSLSIGVLAAGVAVVPDQQIKLVILLVAASVAVAYWCLLSASHWLFVFFLCALLTPPLPVPGLATAVQVAPVVVLLRCDYRWPPALLERKAPAARTFAACVLSRFSRMLRTVPIASVGIVFRRGCGIRLSGQSVSVWNRRLRLLLRFRGTWRVSAGLVR